MKIILAKPYGYCAGVNLSISIAKKTKLKNKNKKVVILGMIVHNNDAINELTECGIETIYFKDKTLLELVDYVEENSIVILSAHGHSEELESKLRSKNIEYIDATCPYVTLVFNEIKKAAKENRDIFYIGKPNHPESNAALSLSKKVHLIDIENPNIELLSSNNSPLIINQTTFSSKEVENISNKIISKFNNATLFKSVCNASKERQQAILNFPKNIDLIYVVGGLNSNNTKTLAKIAKENFPNANVLLIQNKNDINKKDLIDLNCIGIASGASTPKYISEEIRDYLKTLFD